jgi:hypothetical protein
MILARGGIHALLQAISISIWVQVVRPGVR